MRLVAKNEKETIDAGRKLGRRLAAGDVVCLLGELGAGKTTFTKGLAEALGFKGRVTSPTFGLAREYRGKDVRIYHLDLYRVAENETGDIGLEDYLHDPRGVCVIEWPAAVGAFMPQDYITVKLGHRPEGRTIAVTAKGKRSRAVVSELE